MVLVSEAPGVWTMVPLTLDVAEKGLVFAVNQLNLDKLAKLGWIDSPQEIFQVNLNLNLRDPKSRLVLLETLKSLRKCQQGVCQLLAPSAHLRMALPSPQLPLQLIDLLSLLGSASQTRDEELTVTRLVECILSTTLMTA
ncbi:hypothetical protein F2P79_025274 [Pimephales promelas]|nr:hypothetical protein F2P79_025274 [Pimephales promelas]